MFKSLFGIAEDLIKVVAAPIEIAADVTRSVTKPVADVAQEAVKEIKSATKELRED